MRISANCTGDKSPCKDAVLVFNGTSSKDAILDASFLSSIGGIRIESSYTGTVTIRRDVQVRDKIVNSGLLVLEDCTLTLGDSMVPGALVNQVGATLTTLGNVQLTAMHTAAVFTNHGTFQRLDAGTTTFALAFDTDGMVDVQDGCVALQQGGGLGGIFTLAQDTALSMVQGLFTLLPNVQVTGQGLLVTGTIGMEPMVLVAGNVIVANFVFTTGTIDGVGTLNISSSLVWEGGNMGALGSGATVIGANANLQIVGAANKRLIDWTLTNEHVIDWWGGDLTVGSDAVIVNQTGAEFLIHNDGMLTCDNSNGRLENHGALRKLFGAADAQTRLDLQVSHLAGTIQCVMGTVSFKRNSTFSAEISVAPNATVEFASSAIFANVVYSLAGNVSLAGDGLYRVAGAVTLEVNTAGQQLSVANLELAMGSITGSGGLFVTSSFNWEQGKIESLQNGLTINQTANATLTGNNDKALTATLFINEGEMTWSGDGDLTFDQGAILENRNVFEIHNDRRMVCVNGLPTAGMFVNTAGASLYKICGAEDAQTMIVVPTINAGTMDLVGYKMEFVNGLVQTAGVLQVAGGALIVQQIFEVQAGTVNLGASGSLNLWSGTYNQFGGTVNLNGGTISAVQEAYLRGGTINLGGGTFRLTTSTTSFFAISSSGILSGSGTIDGRLLNGGTIRIGGAGAIGNLTVTGTFYNGVAGSDGRLEYDLGGTMDNQFDCLVVQNSATIRGTVVVTLLDYQPQIQDVFRIVRCTGLESVLTFAPTTTWNLPNVGGANWTQIQVGMNLELRVVAAN